MKQIQEALKRLALARVFGWRAGMMGDLADAFERRESPAEIGRLAAFVAARWHDKPAK